MATRKSKYALVWKVVSHDVAVPQGLPERHSITELVPRSIRYSYDLGTSVYAMTPGPLLAFKAPTYARDYLIKLVSTYVSFDYDILLCAVERQNLFGPITSVLGNIIDLPGWRHVPMTLSRTEFYTWLSTNHRYEVKRLLRAFWDKRSPWSLPVILQRNAITKAPVGTVGVMKLHVLKSYLPNLAAANAQHVVMGDIQQGYSAALRDTYSINDQAIDAMIRSHTQPI